jgi:hypothetical protein
MLDQPARRRAQNRNDLATRASGIQAQTNVPKNRLIIKIEHLTLPWKQTNETLDPGHFSIVCRSIHEPQNPNFQHGREQ